MSIITAIDTTEEFWELIRFNYPDPDLDIEKEKTHEH